MSTHPLYRFRQARHMTRETLAKDIGCSTRSLARWEKGDMRPRMALATQASRVTGLSIDELFGEVGASIVVR